MSLHNQVLPSELLTLWLFLQYKIPTFNFVFYSKHSTSLGWCRNQYFCKIHWILFVIKFSNTKTKQKPKSPLLMMVFAAMNVPWFYSCI